MELCFPILKIFFQLQFAVVSLQIDVWVSLVSFHAYADVSFESTDDCGKGVTDLEPCLKKIFGDSLIVKEEFLRSFVSKRHYIRNVVSDGNPVLSATIEDGYESSKVKVIHMSLDDFPVATLYSRLVPLLLLFVEGSSPVDINDPCWDIYFAVKEVSIEGDITFNLIGFSAVYRFYHYPDTTRLRISQILVLPPFQGQGYGRLLLEAINSKAVSDNLYDVTAEEPSDYLQSLRLSMDSLRLLGFGPVQPWIESAATHLREVNGPEEPNKAQMAPPTHVGEQVREELKISRKQFLKCWEILLYLALEGEDEESRRRFRSWVSGRVRNEILGKDSGEKTKQLVEVASDHNPDMSFAVFVGPTGPGRSEVKKLEPEQEQQMELVVDEEMEEIAGIAGKVMSFRK
ncbi:putative histone acetyltransferase type B catalytic subunit [Wolffia australiana]